MAEATAATAPEPDTMRAPVNALVHGRDTPDTLSSSAWLDLAREPLVLTVPDTRGRYYALWLRDAWGNVFASVGARTTGTRQGAFALLGPHHHAMRVPAGLTPIPASTRTVHISGRLEAVGERAGESLRKAYDGFRLTPVANIHEPVATQPVPVMDEGSRLRPRGAGTPVVDALDPVRFFREVLRLAQDEPPDLEGRVLLDRLRELLVREPPVPGTRGGPGAWHRARPRRRARRGRQGAATEEQRLGGGSRRERSGRREPGPRGGRARRPRRRAGGRLPGSARQHRCSRQSAVGGPQLPAALRS